MKYDSWANRPAMEAETITRLTAGRFAADSVSDQLADLRRSIENGDSMEFAPDGTIVRPGSESSLGGDATITSTKKASFAADSVSDQLADLRRSIENGDSMEFAPDGTIVRPGSESSLGGDATITSTKKASFAARQWYQKDRELFDQEQALMHQHFPQAQLGTLKDGRVYWHLPFRIRIGNTFRPYNAMLVYDADHPNNKNYGGSIRCYLVSPTIQELQRRARQAGRESVPHLLRDENNNIHLCTARTSDVDTGVNLVTSAVTAAAWTIKWAYYYEMGLLYDTCWQAFCRH